MAAVLGAACLNRICNRRVLSANFVNGGRLPCVLATFFVFAASQVKFTPCVLAAIISVLCAADAKASPLTYTESATVSTFNVGENVLNSTNQGGGIFQFVNTGTGIGTFSNSDGGTLLVLLDSVTDTSFAVLVAGSPPIRSTCEPVVTGALKNSCPPRCLGPPDRGHGWPQ